MQKTTLALIVFFAIQKFSFSQGSTFFNSREVIQLGKSQRDSGHYKQALFFFDRVSRNDSNYVHALYQKAVTLQADSQYAESIRYCRQALGLSAEREVEAELYNQYGNDLVDLHEFKKAIAVYDSGLVRYPAFSLFQFNRSICYMNMDSLAQAELAFQKTILQNPYQYSGHYFLGLVALRQGKIIPAMLSLIGYLLMNPDGPYGNKALNLLNEIAKSTDDIVLLKNKRSMGAGTSYQETEEIVLSKIALDKQYKPVIKLDDAISRQIQVVFEKLEFSNADPDFYIQYYLPLYRKVFLGSQFEPFINHLFLASSLPVIQDYNKKYKKEIQNMIDSAVVYFNLIKGSRLLPYSARTDAAIYYSYDDNGLVGTGKAINNRQTTVGDWFFTYPEGNKKGIGTYNNDGKRVGEWRFYYYNGALKAVENYKDGKLEGKQLNYFDNGIVFVESNYHEDEREGSYTKYSRVGTAYSISHYSKGKLSGEQKSFYPTGVLNSVTHYVADQEEGTYTIYFENGKIKETGIYNKGLLEGPVKFYYENGTLSVQENYSKDKRTGERNTYHKNAKLKEKAFYDNGLLEGPYEEYYENGQLSTKFNNKKGKTTGEVSYFDDDGKVYSIYLFEKDLIKSARFFDKTGREIGRSERSNKLLDLTAYSVKGYKVKQSPFNEKGDKDGIETTFYPDGRKNERSTYKADELEGLFESFFPNGNTHIRVNMSGGMKNGLYQQYFEHGQLESEGWYIDDVLQGEWKYFDSHGNLSSKSYYVDNDLSGYKEEYWPNGIKNLEERFNQGWLEEMIQYDTSGKELRHEYFPGGNGKYELVYPNGKTMASGSYVHGYLQGKYETYYFDGSAKSLEFFKNDKPDSIHKVFYYGGKVYTEGVDAGGQKSGKWTEYDELGNTRSISNYVDGQLNNLQTYYFKNGKVDRQLMFKDGELDSLMSKFDEDGNLMYKLRYEAGTPVAYTYLDDKNQLISEKPISPASEKIQTYYSNGKISREFALVDGLTHGGDILYFMNGQKLSENTDEFGITEGPFQSFYKNGKSTAIYTYLHDHIDGAFRDFDENGELTEQGITYEGNYHGKVIKYINHQKQTWIYHYGVLLAIQK